MFQEKISESESVTEVELELLACALEIVTDGGKYSNAIRR